ncbi:F-box/FBD/LRR-repeat protein At1g13570 [Helianthus annuus]|uniref:F-box/FBD/LRR-repeat protein At1g13570 n=1 Tax=Helianthus annuus TaxID=4232 RepID=UPI000B8F6D21|nr:F-box/FBD/LRR-repeat protein At1g13570 [Helianthus annuus]
MMDFTTNNERRQVSVEEENGMGKLPEHVMDSILERLPLQDIIRTSILSKKWRYKWTTMKAVVFDEQISNKLAENGAFGRHGFTRVINQVLLLHKGSSISKFYLYIPNMFLDSFQEVDQWIFFLSTKGVEDLTIANSIQLYQLPSCLFSCLELRKLELGKCIFKPPLQFEGFPYLESLTLNNIDFTTTDVVINLPHLTKLILRYCTNVYNLKIKATKLLNLVVIGCPDVMFLELLHSQRVGFLCARLQKPVKDFVRLERMNLALMFTKMPYLVRLFIDAHFLKDFIAEKRKWFPHTVNFLKCLRLYSFSPGDLDHLYGGLCLLRNSPNLEELHVIHIKTESELMHHGVEATSNHLESPNCLDQTLNRLRTVQLSHLQGSKPELLFIKLLLAHSPSLEKFTIQSDGTWDANKRFNITKDVMRFPRASSKAELIYLDPKS